MNQIESARASSLQLKLHLRVSRCHTTVEASVRQRHNSGCPYFAWVGKAFTAQVVNMYVACYAGSL